jgi:hypothetical protein
MRIEISINDCVLAVHGTYIPAQPETVSTPPRDADIEVERIELISGSLFDLLAGNSSMIDEVMEKVRVEI